ncbi:uncharacterized protein LOC101452924 [Ceratitis capitata]|uniref:(Mediterranean fruit fly) hypothetical protein n=1 Tax=Ceratitis capitata TaxID=7213 RepID=A0A811VHC4_CERCA|nr:uncharacterized protein LOC101452924 [Ceratitis capitata]CAD7014481.1 unnamed protein product [Ceratitis capitata]
MPATATATANGKPELEAVKSAQKANDAPAAGNVEAKAAPQLPDWLKEDLFLDFFKANITGFKAINKFSAKPAQGAGENYATIIALVKAEVELEGGKSKEVSYMLKLPIDAVQKLMNSRNIFVIEIMMYSDVIPEMEKMYTDVGVEVKFSPQYYELKTPSKSDVILMEDLRQRGFKNTNRLEGFDMEHTKHTLEKLAQWHAASAVRVETKGKYPDVLNTGLFTDDLLNVMEQMDKMAGTLYEDCVRTYEGHEEYIDSFIKFHDSFFKELRAAKKHDPNAFNVLNHGDFWANNVMFQYDAFGKIKETYFVDFQMPCYGSPVIDLYTILLSSTQLEVKLKHFDYFIKYYHDKLTECLKLLKYPKKLPNLKDIHIALLKYGVFGFTTASGHMAIVLLDPSEAGDLTDMLGDTPASLKHRKAMLTGSRYKEHAKIVFPWLHNRGAFEG